MKRFCALFFLTLLVFPTQVFALTPNDPFYGDQWHLEQIQAGLAWDRQTGSSDIVVAVIDSGVDLDHPDLEQNIWVNTGETINGIDDDGNGYVDDINGWDFVTDDNDPNPDLYDFEGVDPDAVNHGSMVAGIIGAVGNNGIGVTGLAWDVQIMPLRALNSVGAGTSEDVADALEYAIDNGADIVNLSFSGIESDTVLENAIRDAYEAGIVIVAALGNEGQDTDVQAVYPGCLRTETEDWVIGVAASNFQDEKPGFTNYGEACTDLSAPGVSMLSTSYEDIAEGYVDAYQDGWSGTSVAAPVVAGAAALLLAEYPSLTAEDVRLVLELSVDPIPSTEPLRDKLGSGRLNVYRALEIGVNFIEEAVVPTPQPETGDAAYIKGESFSAVYRVIDGERYVFMDALTYFTWEEDFSPVEVVDDSELSNYPLAGVMLPKAGVILVKIQSDPKVYALDPGSFVGAPKLREIDSENVATSIWGERWADYVIDVPPTFFTKFEQGSLIASSSSYSADLDAMKTRLRLAELSQ